MLSNKLVKILLPIDHLGPLDYIWCGEQEIVIGSFVIVPFRNKEMVGIIWAIHNSTNVDQERLKKVKSSIKIPILSESLMHFIIKSANYNMVSLGGILKMVIPNGLNLHKKMAFYEKTIEYQKSTLDIVREVENDTRSEDSKPTKCSVKDERQRDHSNFADYNTFSHLKLSTRSMSDEVDECTIVCDRDRIHEARQHGNLNGERYNIVLPELSDNQKEVVHLINHKIDSKEYNVVLMDGVTGAGKTEVYFASIAKILEEDIGQALILLPEIVLTSQIIQRFTQRFGFTPYSWHSGLTPAHKAKVWADIVSSKAKLVIGARSALFLPFSKLRLIVVDEEHDASYKQEDGVCYHARDMAVLRASKENNTVLLASATPSLESFYNCNKGKFHHITLDNRYNKGFTPDVRIVDMCTEQLDKNNWLSSLMRKELIDNYHKKEQSLLFLNRRGYAPLTLCGKCGYRFICKSCTSWLVEHKALKQLKCHHCSYSTSYPEICPECNSKDTLRACGPGVERIVEEVLSFIPEAKIALMTKDTVNTTSKAEQLINSILANEVDIIIGTQLIAKGHHFPNLAMVGIVDADLGLVGGDLRAAERSYQLLHQVGGRAGREKLFGKIIIQTYNSNNIIIRALASNNREEFLKNEMISRSHGKMPPFTKLAAIIISGHNEEKVQKYSRELVRVAPIYDNITVLGPVPAFLYKLRAKYRYRILVKAERSINLQKYLNYWLSLIKKNSNIKVKIDVDPHNFF
ncbi:Primosomal protein N' [Rickettsiales bacterium Ac37b]|nr:Primosomal protein N' [Rickettsiales bacterium Ac37b]